jgi:large subunit ribosomal protein L9
MEIILKKDVKSLGYSDDLVKVKNGYANNYLIPNGYAVIASETNLKIHTENVKQRKHKLDKVKGDADKLVEALQSVTLTVPVKVGENGKLYGSVTTQNIADTLKKMGYTIDKKDISIVEDHIKQVGSYTATVNVHREIKAKVAFEVVGKEA